MPIRASIKDKVLVVTGSVGEQVASSALADFAEWVQKKSFWQEKIHYVHMKTPQIMVLYLRGDNEPRIMMGPIRGYESKLNKLRTFLENGQQAIGDKKYYEIDVRFNGQVIARF
jgi:cell division protein FtsQ